MINGIKRLVQKNYCICITTIDIEGSGTLASNRAVTVECLEGKPDCCVMMISSSMRTLIIYNSPKHFNYY